MAPVRLPVEPLTRFTSDLLAAGWKIQAEAVARLLVTTDMLGRPTHGVALSRSMSSSLKG
jgi:LDH2 family malate/lactate/ureidoglycolate dehydrogenase